MPDTKKLNIRSEDVNDIISKTPNWMISWGNSFLLGLIILIITASWYFKYPDEISGRVVISTESPPVKLVCKNGGYLEHLYYPDMSYIKKGKTIAEITNPTRREKIEILRNLINQTLSENYLLINLNDSVININGIQQEYNRLIKSIREYKYFLADRHYSKTVQNLNEQIRNINELIIIDNNQIDLMKGDLQNLKVKFQTDSILYLQGIIAKHEYYKQQSQWIAKQQEFERLKKSLIEHQITVIGYQNEKNILQQEILQKQREYKISIESEVKELQNFVDTWQQNYSLISPTDGKLVYLKNLNEKQYVTTGESLFAIVPKSKYYTAIITISAQGYGKVKTGQMVKIKLDNYPYYEFGQVTGIISGISLIPDKGQYMIKVTLPQGLYTTYKKKLAFKPEMTGTAAIVTDDLRLLQRIFYRLRKVINK
ncbi:MAG: HlyD family efflux transporter periplasmic adaptor subunit [Bacteroidales bacterium]|nr:HlyD family efflux transporter periplasmic adaptor subunit [Bacteroidales bacterium]